MTREEIEALRVGVVAVAATAAAVVDYRIWKIPNKFAVALAVTGLIARPALQGWNDGLLDGLKGFAFGFGLLFVMWLIARGGAGDVKFFGAAGIWLGFDKTVVAFIGSAIFVTFIEIARYTLRLISKTPPKRETTAMVGGKRRSIVPFAVPLAGIAWTMFALRMFVLMNR